MLRQFKPNLVRNKIVLELCNRTNTDSTVNILELPQGSNSTLGLTYGESLDGIYNEVTVAQSNFGAEKSWTINWTDEDGASQSETDLKVTSIDDLIAFMNDVSKERFGYYEDGTDYVIFKQCIETYLYWVPPVSLSLGAKTLVTKPAAQSQGVNMIVDALNSSKYYGATETGYFILTNSGAFLAFYNYDSTSADVTKDTSAEYGITTPTALDFHSGSDYLLIADTAGSQDVAVVNMDSSLTLITNLVPSSGATSKGGAVKYLAGQDVIIGYGTAQNPTSSAITVWNGSSLAEVFSGKPTANGIDLNLGGGANLVAVDNSGAVWFLNGNKNRTSLENGIFKFENGVWSQVADRIALQRPAVDQPTSLIHWNGRLFVFGIDKDGGQSFLEVYTTDGQLLYEKEINEPEWVGVHYIPQMDYIVAHDQLTEDFYVVDYDANITQIEVGISGKAVRASKVVNGNQWVLLSRDSTTANITTISNNGLEGSVSGFPANTKNQCVFTNQEFTTLVKNSDGGETFTFTSNTVQNGSGVSITSEDGIPYRELVAGLRENLQKYYLYNAAVYADTLEQANQKITKVYRNGYGVTAKGTNYPALDPMTSQFVQQEIPLNFLLRTIDKLEYKVRASECVKIIIDYFTSDIPEIIKQVDESFSIDPTILVTKYSPKLKPPAKPRSKPLNPILDLLNGDDPIEAPDFDRPDPRDPFKPRIRPWTPRYKPQKPQKPVRPTKPIFPSILPLGDPTGEKGEPYMPTPIPIYPWGRPSKPKGRPKPRPRPHPIDPWGIPDKPVSISPDAPYMPVPFPVYPWMPSGDGSGGGSGDRPSMFPIPWGKPLPTVDPIDFPSGVTPQTVEPNIGTGNVLQDFIREMTRGHVELNAPMRDYDALDMHLGNLNDPDFRQSDKRAHFEDWQEE